MGGARAGLFLGLLLVFGCKDPGASPSADDLRKRPWPPWLHALGDKSFDFTASNELGEKASGTFTFENASTTPALNSPRWSYWASYDLTIKLQSGAPLSSVLSLKSSAGGEEYDCLFDSGNRVLTNLPSAGHLVKTVINCPDVPGTDELIFSDAFPQELRFDGSWKTSDVR